jgi:hypothetical protein
VMSDKQSPSQRKQHDALSHYYMYELEYFYCDTSKDAIPILQLHFY